MLHGADASQVMIRYCTKSANQASAAFAALAPVAAACVCCYCSHAPMLLGIAATVTNLAVTGVPETSAKVVQLLTCC